METKSLGHIASQDSFLEHLMEQIEKKEKEIRELSYCVEVNSDVNKQLNELNDKKDTEIERLIAKTCHCNEWEPLDIEHFYMNYKKENGYTPDAILTIRHFHQNAPPKEEKIKEWCSHMKWRLDSWTYMNCSRVEDETMFCRQCGKARPK